jgi:aspartate kinase
MRTAKFGGSSMATAENIRKCADIIGADANRCVIVVSAMGKYGDYAEKVTDRLIRGCKTSGIKDFSAVFDRFYNLANDLLPPIKFNKFKIELHKTKNEVLNNPDNYAFVVSRGEYLTARMFALYLEFNFVDAVDIIVINPDGTADLRATKRNIKKYKLKKRIPFVLGGFYGRDINGNVALFSRGGSDYSGAVMAVLLKCKIYENWTDTNGLQTADPRFIYGTKTIPCVNFDTLHILTHNGATIIHENVAKLLKTYRLPMRVDNTFNPYKNWTEFHSFKCRKCLNNFFSITHTDDKITVVSKFGKNLRTEKYETTPETLTTDIQRLHNEYLENKIKRLVPLTT